MSALIVLTTVGTEEEANAMARELVGRRHAACVNVLPGVKSTYRWEGKVCRDTEYLLVIKTIAAEYLEVEKAIKELHSYELPEIVALEASRVEPTFLGWIASSLDKSKRSAKSVDDQFEDPPISLDETGY